MTLTFRIQRGQRKSMDFSKDNLSAWPEVRGTADADGGAYSPFRSILLVLTHDFIIIQVYGPTGGDG